MSEKREWPNWIDTIAIDPTGEIYGYEGDAYWDRDLAWIPIDDFDGLRTVYLSTIEPIPKELAKQMYFRKEPQDYENCPPTTEDILEGMDVDFLFEDEIDDRGSNEQD